MSLKRLQKVFNCLQEASRGSQIRDRFHRLFNADFETGSAPTAKLEISNRRQYLRPSSRSDDFLPRNSRGVPYSRGRFPSRVEHPFWCHDWEHCSLVTRIEKIVEGVASQRVERAKIGKSKGLFVCLANGSNKEQVPFATLDEVADYLTTNPSAGV